MDRIDEFLRQVVKEGYYSSYKGDPYNAELLESEDRGLVTEHHKNNYRLTEKGRNVLDSGKSWRAYQGNIKDNPAIHIGHNINAPIHSSESAFNIESKVSTDKTTNKAAHIKPKPHLVQWLVWIVALITGCIAIYKFIIE